MSKYKILLIDDEPALRTIMKLNLERTGDYEVETAASGEEGLKMVERKNYDLVITDFKMPGIDGGIVVEAVKAMKPHAPVVLFSIYHDDNTTISQNIRSKADAIISKPIDHDQLHKAIKDALAKAEA